ncbi:MAG: hypothetical protein B7Z15_00150 [Rhizobiales bacterium 32-66-8]|nr:MAG: hypothetical protein B7Z15_00150 [Rhizobiales bacterium 32-66-8]
MIPTAFAVLVSACSGPPPITSGLDPADPSVAVPAVQYAPVLAGDIDYRPMPPRSWIEQNLGLAPGQGGR